MVNKNLLIISYDYPPSTGGIARLCNEITIGLTAYYKKIKVFTTHNSTSALPYQISTAEITRFPSKRIQCEIATIQAIRKIKNKDSYDVLCGIWHPEVLIALLGGMKNIYLLGHGAEFLSGASKFRKNVWLPLYCKWILKNTKKVITNSNYTKNLVKKIYNKTHTIALPLAVNHNFFIPKSSKVFDKTIKFVTVSRILKFKGHDFILNTFESLPEHISSKIEWHIAGTGPYLEKIKKRVSNSSLKSKIYFHGFVPDKKLPTFYNTKDIFLLATRENKSISHQVEGFGLVFLEAQSCGLPVIGSNTGGIPDAIDINNGGWLFEQDDIVSLRKIITSLVTDKSLIEKQSIKARKRIIEKCTWDIYCNKLFKIITK